MKDAKGHGSDGKGGSGMTRVSVRRPIGSRIVDVGPGGKEYNVQTDKVWDETYGHKGGTPMGAPARPGATAHQTGVTEARAVPRTALAAGGRHGYNPQAVNNAIASSNRAGRRIGGGEARLIHALLKGR